MGQAKSQSLWPTGTSPTTFRSSQSVTRSTNVGYVPLERLKPWDRAMLKPGVAPVLKDSVFSGEAPGKWKCRGDGGTM